MSPHRLFARLREWLEGWDYALQSLPVSDAARACDAGRRRDGLTPFRKAWWLQTRLESYRCLRRYVRLLDWAVSERRGEQGSGFRVQGEEVGSQTSENEARRTKNRERILLLRMGHLGDVLHLMPTVREMRRQRPDWRLELITGPWNKELVETYDLFDEVHYWTPDVVQFHRGNRHAVPAVNGERKWIETVRGEGVDLLFCPSTPHFCELPVIVGLQPRVYVGGEWKLSPELLGIQAFSGQHEEALEGRAPRARLGERLDAPEMEYKILPFNSRHYEMNAIGDFLPLMGLERPELKLFYPISEEARTRVGEKVSRVGCRVTGAESQKSEAKEQSTTPYPASRISYPASRIPHPATRLVLVFPGSGWRGKNWPSARFAELGDWLIDQRAARVVLLGAPSEKDLCARVCDAMRGNGENWAGTLSLDESAALIEQAALVIGNDSAPIHLAAALDIPTVSLWGPTVPEKWAPKGERHVVVGGGASCAGCTYWHSSAACRGLPPCMTTITVEQVVDVLSGWGSRGSE